jgi:CobQ-like glutamine amidotransferase family enzyme
MSFELTRIGIGEDFDPFSHDLFYLGGGQDRDQRLCAQDLSETKRECLHAAANSDAVVFAVCGGYQLLGNYYEANRERLPGVGLLDLHTISTEEKRLIGNVAITVNEQLLGDGARSHNVLAGFENHGGRTQLGPNVSPLGKVLSGHGNNGSDGGEGAIGGPSNNIIGTYLHGPLLPKNIWFADWLIQKALKLSRIETEQLDDSLAEQAHIAARQAARV